MLIANHKFARRDKSARLSSPFFLFSFTIYEQ